MRKILLYFMTAIILFTPMQMVQASQLPESTEIESTKESVTESITEVLPPQSKDAVETQPVSESQAESEGDLQNLLTVDDNNIYDGMSQAYKDGYEPVVSNNFASVVIPIITEEQIDISSIKVTPDLGATENSPFVYRNYQKTVQRTTEKINGSDVEASVFLVKFDFELQSDRYNGVYPVVLNVNYTYGGMSLSQTFTTYIRITDGKSTEVETEPAVAVETEEDPTSEPKVIIEKCISKPEKIQSGDEFSFKAVLKNTNKLKSIQNMTVTISTGADTLSLVADSNVFYYDYLGAGESLEIPLAFKCSDSTAAGKYTLTLEMSYDNPDAVSLTSTGKIEINISQKIEMDLEVGSIASEVNAGDSLSMTVQALNLGRGKVYNARCSVDVPGLTADKSLFLGNMEGGSAASGEISVFAGMVNEDAASDSERYGTTMGTIILTYEDESGDEYSVTKEIKLKINPLEIGSGLDTSDSEKDEGIGVQLLVGTALLLGTACAVTGISLLLRRRKKRKESHDELG